MNPLNKDHPYPTDFGFGGGLFIVVMGTTVPRIILVSVNVAVDLI